LTEWTTANIKHHADIQFTGNVPYEQVADLMRTAHCLVISSVYETFSCVAIEALLCGLPVISTPVGILPEVINTDNGILAHDEAGFVAAMKSVYLNWHRYNPTVISRVQRGRFSFQTVGNKLIELYATL
jgi:glycosyltransferase involved in cell wall biosynthesis